MAVHLKAGIACGGSWIIDHVKQIDDYPQESSLAEIFDETLSGGGCAFNVIINLAKFDPTLALTALGVIGADADGDFVLEECRRHAHIDTQFLYRTHQHCTSYTDVYNVKATGRRTFFHYRGANQLFGEENVPIEALHVSMFHLGYLLLLDRLDQADRDYGRASARLLHHLQEAGIRTSIDLVSINNSDFADIVAPALPFTDYCIINDFEAEKLTNISIRVGGRLNRNRLKDASEMIFRGGVKEWVVIHFPEGAYLRTRSGEELVQPSLQLPPDFIVGSAGAGDSFCSGILYGIYRGWDLEKTAQFAVCAGAQNLRAITTTGSISNWEKILALKEECAFRPSFC